MEIEDREIEILIKCRRREHIFENNTKLLTSYKAPLQ